MKKLITAIMLVGCICLLSVSVHAAPYALCEFEGESFCKISVKLPEPWLKTVDFSMPGMDGYETGIWVKGTAHDMDITVLHDAPAPPAGFCEVHFQCEKFYKDTYMLFPINKPYR